MVLLYFNAERYPSPLNSDVLFSVETGTPQQELQSKLPITCHGIPLSCKYDDLDWRGSLDRIVYSVEFACRLSYSTRGVDTFDANNH